MQNAYDNNPEHSNVDDIVFDETIAVPSFDVGAVMTSVHRHLDSHQILGNDWPNEATYAMTYRTKTWPCGWDEYDNVRFFANSDELSRFVRRMNNWSREEDNAWTYTLYMWDLGPIMIYDVEAHIHN